jgi:hypothetical protein
MNDEYGGMQVETLLIITCILGVFAAAVFFAMRANTRRASMIQDFAKIRGWNYARRDTQELSAKVDLFFPDEVFNLDNIITIESGVRSLFFFDCEYHYRERRRGGNFGTGCLIESDRFRTVKSTIEIVARNWANTELITDQVDIGNKAFSRDFIVISKDPESASMVLTDALQSAFVTHRQMPLFNPVRVSISSGGAVLLTGLNAEPQRWQDIVELARKIEETLP